MQAIIKTWPKRLSLAQLPTPLEPLERLQQQLKLGSEQPKIWVKRDDLTGCVESGNKIRKLEFIFAQAQAAGCTAVITCGGLQSNHCRATAVLAARLGLQAHLVLRGDKPEFGDGNLLLGQLAGAQIDYIALKTYLQSLDALLLAKQQALAEQGIKAWIIPTGASDGHGIWGYLQAAAELKQDFARMQLEGEVAIVCASGSGGTQAGLTLGADILGLNASVFGINVCDDEAYFKAKVAADIASWQQLYQAHLAPNYHFDEQQIHVLDGYVGAGYAQASAPIFATIKQLMQSQGLLLDPVYTAKAFYGLLDHLQQGSFKRFKHVVFIHTGGSFGLYPYKEQLS